MLVDVEQLRDICIVRFHGRLAAGIELEYLGAKAEEIKKLNCSKVLADFRDVPAVGSTGIGFGVSLYTRVKTLPDGRFVVAGARGRVREVLDLTRLSTILPMAPDFEAGVAFLDQRDAGAAEIQR